MPIYEFECRNCGKIQEKIMKITDSHPEVCTECQKGPLVKLMSRTNFVLKGQGWYETDFKDKGKASGISSKDSEGKPKDQTAGKGKEKAEAVPKASSNATKAESSPANASSPSK